MSNPNGRKGAGWETTVVGYLKQWFPLAERRVTNGVNDRGDVSGIPLVMLECKNEKKIDLAGYMDEVRVEKANAHAHIAAAVVKRRNYGVERAYVVMEFADWVELIRDP